ncbi:MAG: 50S ribosomal protein L11 methyltransferase, partial [Bacteroidota bacterium]
MKYIELTCKLPDDFPEASDILVAILSEEGFEGFQEKKGAIIGYTTEKLFNLQAFKGIINDLPFSCEFTFKTIPDINWNIYWEENFQPISIDDLCIVHASFHAISHEYPYRILIDPKMSFGTGHHETTELMIRNILELDMDRKKVADIGCGTGILGILASMKKADSVTSTDIDHWAIENTVENCRKNNICNLDVIEGDIETLNGRQFDVILANINRNVLALHIPYYEKLLNKKGLLLMSGFLEEDYGLIREK